MINVKIINGRFVSCWPMPHLTTNQLRGLTWVQSPRSHANPFFYQYEEAPSMSVDYAMSKEDQ